MLEAEELEKRGAARRAQAQKPLLLRGEWKAGESRVGGVSFKGLEGSRFGIYGLELSGLGLLGLYGVCGAALRSTFFCTRSLTACSGTRAMFFVWHAEGTWRIEWNGHFHFSWFCQKMFGDSRPYPDSDYMRMCGAKYANQVLQLPLLDRKIEKGCPLISALAQVQSDHDVITIAVRESVPIEPWLRLLPGKS